MPRVSEIAAFLDAFAPPKLAEAWDNVGLLVGDRAAEASRVMTCLTITPASAAEAVRERCGLIVTHHPLPFHPLIRITSDSPEGRLLLQLIEAKVAVISPHTAFDSAAQGINQRLAEGLGLRSIAPLAANADDASLGGGRFGELLSALKLNELASAARSFLRIKHAKIVGELERPVRRVAVACGSAGSFLSAARQQGCDAMLTGETSFHTCLEAEATDIGLVLVGHYASERFGVEALADVLQREFPDASVWPSRNERDPLVWV